MRGVRIAIDPDAGAPSLTARTFTLAATAMVAFAANSVLARLALGPELIDPASFALIRIASGALVLSVLATALGPGARSRWSWWSSGSWASAACLATYAVGFAAAYLTLGAATGALALFAAVQITIQGTAMVRGERPGRNAWAGFALATVGFIALALPGANAPDRVGLALMMAAGAAWGAYSLRGRGTLRPIDATAGNFVRGVPFVIVVATVTFAVGPPSATATAYGVVLAVLSGAIASGIGYAIWYAALPHLTRVQSGVVQLTPAPLAALGGLLLIGEPLTPRVLGSSLLILGGVAWSLVPGRTQASSPTAQ